MEENLFDGWRRVTLHPNMAAVQNNFLGRLYTSDIFLIYRAISGTYATYPSLPAALGMISVHSDISQWLGYLLPTTKKVQYAGDLVEIYYNEHVKADLSTLPELRISGLWDGIDRFTELLRENAKAIGEPFPKFTAVRPPFRKLELKHEEIPADARFIYYTYRGDVDWAEEMLYLLATYAPEATLMMGPLKVDQERIFDLYTEWIKGRVSGVETTRKARIMSKVILLSNYRWWLLTSDLLYDVDPKFSDRDFTKGVSLIARKLREEAEGIRI